MAAALSFAAFTKCETILRLIPLQTSVLSRSLQSSVVASGGNFPERERYYQRSLGHERGPLTEQPDWSYSDGTAAPLTGRKRRLRIKQMEYAKKIVQLLGEVDFAVERRRSILEEERNEKQRILDEKLKPKCEDLVSAKS